MSGSRQHATLTPVDAILDRRLLGASPAFEDLSTWTAGLDLMRVVYGVPVNEAGLRRFRTATGRDRPRERGYPEAAVIVGRQSGKIRMAAAIVAFEAARQPPSRDGERYALLIAQDQRSALRTAFSYVRAFFASSPILEDMVEGETTDTIRLSNGVRVAAYPCRPASVRGLRVVVAAVDELAHFTATDGRPTDVEMLRALRPTLATTGGKLIVLSSPYGQTGVLWDLHRRHFGRDESETLIWQASAPEMNPTLPKDYLERMREDDPEGYRSEVLGEFRAGLTTLFDPEALDACVASDRLELPPVREASYRGFVDPSGGRRDAFSCAIGHRDGNRIVVDVVRAWPAPFNPTGVTEECSELLKLYRVRRVVGDRYGGEWPREAFRSHRVEYSVAEKDRSQLYLALLPTVNSASVEIPDDTVLLRELRGLERKRGSSGRDRVDHRPGSHDDRANALAGVVSLLTKRRTDITGMDLSGFEQQSHWRL